MCGHDGGGFTFFVPFSFLLVQKSKPLYLEGRPVIFCGPFSAICEKSSLRTITLRWAA